MTIRIDEADSNPQIMIKQQRKYWEMDEYPLLISIIMDFICLIRHKVINYKIRVDNKSGKRRLTKGLCIIMLTMLNIEKLAVLHLLHDTKTTVISLSHLTCCNKWHLAIRISQNLFLTISVLNEGYSRNTPYALN